MISYYQSGYQGVTGWVFHNFTTGTLALGHRVTHSDDAHFDDKYLYWGKEIIAGKLHLMCPSQETSWAHQSKFYQSKFYCTKCQRRFACMTGEDAWRNAPLLFVRNYGLDTKVLRYVKAYLHNATFVDDVPQAMRNLVARDAREKIRQFRSSGKMMKE